MPEVGWNRIHTHLPHFSMDIKAGIAQLGDLFG